MKISRHCPAPVLFTPLPVDFARAGDKVLSVHAAPNFILKSGLSQIYDPPLPNLVICDGRSGNLNDHGHLEEGYYYTMPWPTYIQGLISDHSHKFSLLF